MFFCKEKCVHTTQWSKERLQRETFGNTALFWKYCEEAEQIIQSIVDYMTENYFKPDFSAQTGS